MISNEQFQPISHLNLDPIKVKLMHCESGEGWSLEKTNAVEKEYRRFLFLMMLFPNEETAPLADVDTFWHYHILDTMKYADDCARVFGYFLHHYPYVGLRGDGDEQVRQASAERMRDLYERTFNERYVQADAIEEHAYCGATAQAAYCGATGKAAYCGVTGKAAYCGVTTQAAYCGTTEKAAYCGVTAQAAYCGVTAQAAYCGTTAKAAYCGVTARAGYCGATAQSAYCGTTTTPGQNRETNTAQTAYCGTTGKTANRVSIRAKAGYCGAGAATNASRRSGQPLLASA